MAASRLVQTVQAGLSVSYQYDAAGRRTRMTWPDGFYVTFGYDALGRVTGMWENGSALIASFAYDDQGRRTQLSRGNGTTTSYAYDALGRLTRLTHDLAGTAADYDAEFTYDPLGRIVSRTQANGLYHWPVTTVSGTAGVNGLDQLTSSGGTSLTYDGRGNLAGRGAWGYAHDVENRLTQVTGPVNLTLAYDALGRLERLIESGQDTRFLWDGVQVIGELDAASGAVKRRYVPGPGTNEVVAWYEGSGVGDRRFIHQDERGSVVAVANNAGAAIATFRYGPWGESSDTAFSRFGYTGAIRLPGTDLLHMRARVYATELARFLEPDPIGFASGQLNLYAYVGGDPINGVDPSGLTASCNAAECPTGPPIDYPPNVEPVPCPPGIAGDPVYSGCGRITGSAPSGSISNTGALVGGLFSGPGVSAAPMEVRMIVPEDGGAAPVSPIEIDFPDKGQEVARPLFERLADCAAEQFGLKDLFALGAVLAGQPIIRTRGKFGAAVKGTSPASMISRKLFGDIRLPFEVPTLTGFPGVGRGLRVVFVRNVGAILGRSIPVVGFGLLAYDAISIVSCVVDDNDSS